MIFNIRLWKRINTKKKKKRKISFANSFSMDKKHKCKLHLFYIRVLDKNNVITDFPCHSYYFNKKKKKKYLHGNWALKSISSTFTPVTLILVWNENCFRICANIFVSTLTSYVTQYMYTFALVNRFRDNLQLFEALSLVT